MDVDFLTGDDPAWLALVDALPHDVYHLPSYVAMAAGQESGEAQAEARAVIVHDRDQAMLIPMMTRRIPGADGARDAISPYGYPGPLFRGDPKADFVVEASRAMVSRLRDEGIVSLFVRTHPILNREIPGAAAVGTIVEHGETVSIDLTTSPEEIWGGTRSRFRSYINGALRAGRRAYIDEDWTHEQAFVELYTATMHRVSATADYMFGLDYVRSLRAALGSRLHLCVVEVDGTVAAAGLFTEEDGIVQYHLSGTDEAFERERPTMLMIHFVRTLMKERNNRVMHLGGGLGAARDSLFEFKAGFSKQRELFRTWRLVVDPEKYGARARQRDPLADVADLDGFFPVYRRPPA
jgi:Acetyltransferase (GNAT) domain